MNIQQVMLTNAGLLAEAMAKEGYRRCVMHYSGGGDDGNIDATTFECLTAADSDPTTGPFGHVTLVGADGKPGSSMDLESAAEIVLAQAMTVAGLEGFETNEGGEGTFTLTATGEIELCHVGFYDEEDEGDPLEAVYRYTTQDLPKAA